MSVEAGGYVIKYKINAQNERVLKNEKGIALISSLFILALMMIISVSILNSVQRKNEIKNQVNIRLKAANVRYKLLSIVNNKANWELTQKMNQGALLSNSQTGGKSGQGSGGSQPPQANNDKIDLYDAESGEKIIDSKNPNTGFTLEGLSCKTFNSTHGDESCVFKYLVSLKSKTLNGMGEPLSYTIHSELLYKPAKTKYPFNPKTNFYSFDQVIDYSNGGSNSNLFQDQANDICVKYGGVYDYKSNTCSKQMTQPSIVCAEGQTYSGPDLDKICQTMTIANNSCVTGQYMAGFDPVTHLPVCKDY